MTETTIPAVLATSISVLNAQMQLPIDAKSQQVETEDLIPSDKGYRLTTKCYRKRLIKGVKSNAMSTRFDLSVIPKELLSFIFKFLDPKSLGRLTRVCKIFHQILGFDQSVCISLDKLIKIWRTVRQNHLPCLEACFADNFTRDLAIRIPEGQLLLQYTEQKLLAILCTHPG